MEDADFDDAMARPTQPTAVSHAKMLKMLKMLKSRHAQDDDDFEIKAFDMEDDLDSPPTKPPGAKKKSKFRVPAPEAAPSEDSLGYWDDVEPPSPKTRGKFDRYAPARGDQAAVTPPRADAKPSRASVYAQQREHELRRRQESLRSPLMHRSARDLTASERSGTTSSEFKDNYQYREVGHGFGGEHPSPYMPYESDLLADDRSFYGREMPERQRYQARGPRAPMSFHGDRYYDDERFGMPPRRQHGYSYELGDERGWRDHYMSGERSVYSDGPVHFRRGDARDPRGGQEGMSVDERGYPPRGYHPPYPYGGPHYDSREYQGGYPGPLRMDDADLHVSPRDAKHKYEHERDDKTTDYDDEPISERKLDEDSGKTDAPADTQNDAAAPNPGCSYAEKNPPFDISAVDMSDMKEFLLRPAPKQAGVMQCYIRRNRNGTKMLFPQYVVHLKDDANRNEVFLMSAKKLAKYGTAYYAISLSSREKSRSGESYLGKVRGNNFSGTEYCIFDSGVNPRHLHTEGGDRRNVPARRELGVVMYRSNNSGDAGPRKMDVCIPEVSDVDDSVKEWRPFHHDEEMMAQAKLRNFRNLLNLVNKPPVWNDQVEAYVLDFNGRVTMASVKNFQLVRAVDPDRIILQFGRVGDTEFTMDFQWPLSPFQAFAISLTCFDTKCGQN
eukprot:scaffold495_cov243-Pinguiococcus_pyrenoidosus.AAC.14